MGMQSIQCPSCGANIEIDDARETCFCTYCGSQIQRDPTNTVTHRTVDVAKIKAIESNERLEKEAREERKENDKNLNRILIGVGIFLILDLGFISCSGLSGDKELKQERKRLDSIVSEVQEELEEEKYDSALIKANGLYMASGIGSEEEREQWDRQREELIRLIKRKKGDPVDETPVKQTEAVKTLAEESKTKKETKPAEKTKAAETSAKTEAETSQTSGKVQAPGDKYTFLFDNYKDVEAAFISAGFTNIQTAPVYDIFWGFTSEGEIDEASIDGRTDYKSGDSFNHDVEVIITYHMKIEDDPSLSTKNSGSSESNSSSEESEEVHSYTRIDIDVLEKALDENAAAAKADYDNQYLEIVGRVGTIDSDLKYISLKSPSDSWDLVGVHCSIKNEATKEKVKTLKKDQIVAVRGKITDVGEILGYYLDIHEIVTE